MLGGKEGSLKKKKEKKKKKTTTKCLGELL